MIVLLIAVCVVGYAAIVGVRLTRRYDALVDAVATLQDQMWKTYAEIADLAAISAEALESEPSEPDPAETN